MQMFAEKRTSMTSFAAVLTVLSVLAPTLAGCSPAGSGQSSSAPVSGPGAMQRAPVSAPPKQGMSTGKKLAILAGTAAVIYLYNKHKNAKGAGEQGQYYRSKTNGRVYYRDAKGNAVYVTAPKTPIQIPADEAKLYEDAAQSGNYDVPTSSAPGGPGSLSGPRGRM